MPAPSTDSLAAARLAHRAAVRKVERDRASAAFVPVEVTRALDAFGALLDALDAPHPVAPPRFKRSGRAVV